MWNTLHIQFESEYTNCHDEALVTIAMALGIHIPHLDFITQMATTWHFCCKHHKSTLRGG